MPRFKDFEPTGVIPATLLAFNEDFSIDEDSTRRHLRDVCSVDGISAVAVNAHASEVHACTFEEQVRILDLTMEEVGDRSAGDQRDLCRRQSRGGEDRPHGRSRRGRRRCSFCRPIRSGCSAGRSGRRAR